MSTPVDPAPQQPDALPPTAPEQPDAPQPAAGASKKRRQPEQQAPPVQRLRVRYAKRGPARFTSHRDVGRALERALRRADVPMAYSSGFNPHPRISYANASPTSAATEAEYLELGLSEVCDPAKVRDALDEVLGTGLDVVEVVEASSTSMNDLLTASAWRIDLGEVDRDVLEGAVEQLLATDELHVQRMTKSGMRDFDVRAAVIELRLDPEGQLLLLGRHGTPLVRPDDVVTALRSLAPELAVERSPLLTRLGQGRELDDPAPGTLLDPFTDAPVALF